MKAREKFIMSLYDATRVFRGPEMLTDALDAYLDERENKILTQTGDCIAAIIAKNVQQKSDAPECYDTAKCVCKCCEKTAIDLVPLCRHAHAGETLFCVETSFTDMGACPPVVDRRKTFRLRGKDARDVIAKHIPNPLYKILSVKPA